MCARVCVYVCMLLKDQQMILNLVFGFCKLSFRKYLCDTCFWHSSPLQGVVIVSPVLITFILKVVS